MMETDHPAQMRKMIGVLEWRTHQVVHFDGYVPVKINDEKT